MAEIILSGDELVGILGENGLIPDHVSVVETDDDRIGLRVHTGWPLVKSVRVSVRFAGFENGCAVVQLMTNRLLDRLDWLIDRMLATRPLADQGARWQYPRLYVDVNKLLQQQVRGVQITNIAFRDGRFHITTIPAAPHEPPAVAARGPQADSASVTPQPA